MPPPKCLTTALELGVASVFSRVDASCPRRVMVYTDGSCKGPTDNRHAGYGVYWGPDHPW
ncbi:unnamed protein product [Trichobilharzia regenti]|nr:unnamed protein product [Trichobilharzia regenti]